MASSVKRADPPCTMLIDSTSMEPPQIMALKKALEEGKDAQKIEVLKKIIIMMINGESFPQLLMPIILNVSTSKDRTIKKLLLLFWEIADKKSADGKLLSEMYLVWYVYRLKYIQCIDNSFQQCIDAGFNPSQ